MHLMIYLLDIYMSITSPYLNFSQWKCSMFILRKKCKERRESEFIGNSCGSHSQPQGHPPSFTFCDSTSSTLPLTSCSELCGPLSWGASFFSWGLEDSSTRATVGLQHITVLVKCCGSGKESHTETQPSLRKAPKDCLSYSTPGRMQSAACPGQEK